MSAIVFLDLETSGLDPERNEILELAMIAVEYVSLREIAAVTTPVVASSGVCGQMDARCFAMHEQSGLLAELRGPRSVLQFEHGGFPTLAQLEPLAIGWMNQYGGQRSPMAGYSPHGVDRPFLKRYMPGLERNFSHRNLDVSFIHQLREIVTGERSEKAGVTHRALDDCRHAAAALRSFLGGRPA
jgi:oligoribonuclease